MNEEKLRAEFEALVTAPFWTNNINHGHVFSVSKTVQGNMYVDTLTEYCWQVYKVTTRKLHHEFDTLQGLWATDKPEHISPELAPYFFRIGYPNEKLSATSKNENLFLGDSTYPHTPAPRKIYEL